MAKTAKPKSKSTSNPRSRAAKRAASPSIDIDKSLKEADRVDVGPILHTHHSAGISKPKKKAKSMKRGQRARQERGLARAEAVMNQMEKKVSGAQSREKRRRERRGLWHEVNEASKEELRKAPRFAVLQSVEDGDEGGWEDEENEENGDDVEMKVVDGVQVPATAADIKMVVVERPASASVAPTEEDEIT